MAIIGLTDRHAAFPRIGVLRKGAEKPKQGNMPGKDLEYFRFDTGDKAAEQAFGAAYGAQPQQINVYLPYPTPEQNFQAWREEWVAGGLRHRCDGQTMTQHLTAAGGYATERKPCPYANGSQQRTAQNPGCKPVGRLMVIVPELRRLAYVQVQTTSIHDIIELQANLEAAYALRGNLQGIPFVLRRQAREISTPGPDGKRVRRVKFLLYIEPSPEWVGLQLQAMRYQALPAVPGQPAPGQTLALPVLASIGEYEAVNVETGEIMDDEDEEEEGGQVAAGILPAENGSQRTENGGRQTEEGLAALWAKQAPQFAHAPMPANGNWGATQEVINGIVGGSDNRHRLYSLLFGRQIASASELTAPEAAWLLAFVRAHKGPGGWQANEKAESLLIAFWMQHTPAPTDGSQESLLAEAAATNPKSAYGAGAL